eukprot:c38745_g1_i1.p1 GENE.c38745_g1_i1~~c38745_g1_i1.p1  ORF type:complete len:201 (-),score=48.45 c38745_g1_i1:30-632(-)
MGTRKFTEMVSMKTVKRLSASVLGCGEKKVWLDPNEMTELATANSRQNVRRFIKNGLIIKRPSNSISRSRTRLRNAMKRLGRHSGTGKRKGTRNARHPAKAIWMQRQRVLRRLLQKYREAKKIDKYMYHDLYCKSKGNVFKNKRVLIEYIHKTKSEAVREVNLAAAAVARREKTQALKDRRLSRKTEAARLAAESYEAKA